MIKLHLLLKSIYTDSTDKSTADLFRNDQKEVKTT